LNVEGLPNEIGVASGVVGVVIKGGSGLVGVVTCDKRKDEMGGNEGKLKDLEEKGS
jgi:hypothetical protein